ncbi:aldo/keto reductase [Phycicoccus sp. Soil802]|uniref:aldo/keto reductase n=1 Tax=Phycicoccus sp. Soil802 TaxID=1736414 RepID=UPI000ADE628E|nr:aldo/keto reductase [Phycicoccus sp. Soil802]
MTEPDPVTRRIGQFEVSPIGLGCMNLSHAYGTPPRPADAEQVLLTALELGVTLFDTAALYGFGANEELVGRVLKPHRDRIVLASKCGMTGVDGKRVIDGRPDTIRRTADAALSRLGTEVIDLYYLHRRDFSVPIEESVGALAELVAAGKVRAIGLSEVSAETLRRAHAVHPVAALQNEYSLWSRNPELGTHAVCRELGIALVAFSPLARGFLTASPPVMKSLPLNDIRQNMPRFDTVNYPLNLAIHARLITLARDFGCTLSQLALAWLLSRGDHVIPIAGTRSATHLRDNLKALPLAVPPDVLAAAADLLNAVTVHGARYNATTALEIDTEAFVAAG